MEQLMPSSTARSLLGIKIVEMDAIGPVPLAAMLLADMGAEIVRIEKKTDAAPVWDDVGAAVLHRGRSAIKLDLKDDKDRAALLALIDNADGLIEGFRPGVMERLGLGPDVCLSRNPRLVYGRMTGWGQTGPLAQRAGHDINYIALTGALHAMGAPGQPPPAPLNLVGDYGGGAMFLVAGILAGLLAARAQGVGQVVDACITDGVTSLMSLFHAFRDNGSWVDAPGSNLLDGGAPFYRCYTCADGRYIAVGCLEPQFFQAMIAGLGLQDRGYDQNDRSGWPAMATDFDDVFRQKSRDEWSRHFAGSDACVTPVLSLAEAVLHPQNRERGAYIERNGFAQPAPAPRFSLTPSAVVEAQRTDIDSLTERWRAVQ